MENKKPDIPIGKIVPNVRALMFRAGFRHVSQLVEASGVSRTTVSALYDNKTTRIDFETIARLCHALKCTPGELLVLSEAYSNSDHSPQ